ncbi:MAG: HEAT repeat domain-containing protein, partial [Planctomycetota bacterium]
MACRNFVALALFLALAPLYADESRLKNGNVIRGDIVSEGPEAVTVRTDHGLIELSRTQIASIHRSESSNEPGAPPPAEDIVRWIEDLKGNDPLRRESAAAGLSKAGERGVLLLADLVADPGSKLPARQTAALCLARIGRPAVQALGSILGGTDRQARIFAIQALGRMGRIAGPAVQKMVGLFTREKQAPMKRLLKSALWTICLDSPAGSFPELESAIKTENERLAMSVLKMIVAGQEKFKIAACLDRDGNGVGEYGYLGELAGSRPLRGTEDKVPGAPFIDPRLGRADPKGCCHFAGYSYVLYLQGNRTSVHEMGIERGRFPRKQERDFVCYGFPRRPGRTGDRVLAVNSANTILSIPNTAGEWGGDRVPPPGLSFTEGKDPSGIGVRFVNGGERGGASEAWEIWSVDSEPARAGPHLGHDSTGIDGSIQVWEEELRRVHGQAVDNWLSRLGDGPAGDRATSDFLEEIDGAARAAGYEDRNHMLSEAAAVMGRSRLVGFWEDLADERAARLQDTLEKSGPPAAPADSTAKPARRLDGSEGYAESLQDLPQARRDAVRKSSLGWVIPYIVALILSLYLLFVKAGFRGGSGAGLSLVLAGAYILLSRSMAFWAIDRIEFTGFTLGPAVIDSS